MIKNTVLKEYIKKSHLTQKEIAEQMKISISSLNQKLNNHREFKTIEISYLQNILNLSREERDAIFFNVNVDLKSTKGEG